MIRVLKVYRVSQKFVPLLYKSVFQYDWTWYANQLIKSCVFQSNSLSSYLLCHPLTRIFDLCTRAPKVRVREYIYQPHNFVFYNPNCRNSSLLFLWILRKIYPLNAKTVSYVWECTLLFTGLSVVATAKNLEKSEYWWYNDHGKMKALKARNEGEHQKYWIKQLKYIVLKKARYKIGDSMRKLSRN